MTAVEASSADVELRARATGFVRRAFVRSADAAPSKLMLVVSATPVHSSVPTASRSLPALGPPENSGCRC